MDVIYIALYRDGTARYYDTEGAWCQEYGPRPMAVRHFPTLIDAEHWHRSLPAMTEVVPDGYVAYVDGSYSRRSCRVGWASTILQKEDGEETMLCEMGDSRRVRSPYASEIAEYSAALRAIRYCYHHDFMPLTVVCDYTGIVLSLERIYSWIYSHPEHHVRTYRSGVYRIVHDNNVQFSVIRGHSGDRWHDRVDARSRDLRVRSEKLFPERVC